jgi:hypothetical protein
MMTDAAWRMAICNCTFGLGPADGGHTRIDPAVDGYIEARAAGIAEVNVVRPPAQAAGQNGDFDIDLGPTNKAGQPAASIHFPTGGGNVVPGSITVVVEGGRLRVRGRLIDPTMPGRFYLRVDPPALWIIVGIEQAVVVLPFDGNVTAIPALSGRGLAALAALLAVAGAAWVFARRSLR